MSYWQKRALRRAKEISKESSHVFTLVYLCLQSNQTGPCCNITQRNYDISQGPACINIQPRARLRRGISGSAQVALAGRHLVLGEALGELGRGCRASTHKVVGPH